MPTRRNIALLALLLTVQSPPALCAQRKPAVASDSGAVVAWIRLHAAPLKTVEPGNGFDDMEPIRRMVGDAHVVSLGEVTHGSHEIFRLKHRMVEFLVTQMGFTVFAREAPMAEGFELNRILQRGGADPDLLAASEAWPQNTEENADLLRWIQKYNANAAHTRKVQFYGIDGQISGQPATVTLDYLTRVDPALERRARRILGALTDPFWATNRRDLPKAQYDSLLPVARLVLATMDERREAYAARTSPAEFDVARQHARLLVESFEQMLGGESAARIRNKAMAENVEWIKAHEPPGTKIIVWSHNGHAFSRCPPAYPMGCHLRADLGADYRVFLTVFNRGEFHASNGNSTLPHGGIKTFKVDPLPDSSLSNTIARAGFPVAALDVHDVPDTGSVADWFAHPHLVRESGAPYTGGARHIHPWIPRQMTDVLLFVDSTTASHVRPTVETVDGTVLPEPTNLDFEKTLPDGRPAGWYIDLLQRDAGYSVSLAQDHPHHGRNTAVIAHDPVVQYFLHARPGSIRQTFDATPYHGKRLRVRAFMQLTGDSTSGRGHLWMRSSDGVLSESTVGTGKEWRPYETTLDISAIARTIDLGVSNSGNGRLAIDDMTLEVVPR